MLNWRKATWLPWALLILGLAAICFWLGARAGSATSELTQIINPPPQRTVTVQMLRTEELLTLVTHRQVTQIVVEQLEHSALLGGREGYLVATVKLYYGIDMQKLTDASIREEAGRVIVRVPQPALLDFTVDPDMKFISKRTGLQAIKDWVLDKNLEVELRQQLREQAMKFLHDNGQMPDPQSALARLNRMADLLGARAGREIVFEYEPAPR